MSTTPSDHIRDFPIQDLEFFSAFDRRFCASDPALIPFLARPASPESFREAAVQKEQNYRHRVRLAQLLKHQYDGVLLNPLLERNIEGLSTGNAFSITTAHQPLIFGGTLYFLYKALTTISLAQAVEGWLGGHQVVPVFVLGSEDHDYEEVRHVQLFSETLTWNSGQEGGPVGRMPQGNIPELIQQAEELFQPLPFGREAVELLKNAYTEDTRFGRSTFQFLHQLFGKHGLVVVDMDSPIAKSVCIPLFEDELTNGFSKPVVEKTLEELDQAGFKQQAHVRAINLFYLLDQQRDRIESDDHSGFRTVSKSHAWSREEMIQELHQHPERFSPNVILRPLLQESILPNLAFVGGAGELAYWVQLSSLFKEASIPYPILIRRHSAQLIDEITQQKLVKLGLSLESTFHPMERLLQEYVHEKSELTADLEKEKRALQKIMIQVKEKCSAIDPTLERSAESTEVQIDKLLQTLETKMTRGLKQLHERDVQQIRSLYDRLFPDGKLQERTENMLPWLARYGHQWIDDLLQAFRPLDQVFVCYSF
ncbi:MAG: bacillithiol biosynthesis cysteine-adding enzyme BshC [Saprospiraceae bacterium]|nr:bacillithiol biosynthesis cysteine-adding enzyme BshC [Saprospiraceae bacterium]